MLLGFILSIVLIFSLGLLSFLYLRNLIEVGRWGAHARQVLYHAEQARSISMKIQAAQLHFALTGDSSFLKPYPAAVRSIRSYIDGLDSLVADNPHQRVRVADLDKAVMARIAFADRVIEHRQEGQPTALVREQAREGAVLTENLQRTIDEIQQAENTLLHDRSAQAGKEFYRFAFTFLGLLITTFLILVVLFYIINEAFKARAIVEQKLKKASADANDLYENAPCGYFSIDAGGVFTNINKTMLTWLGYNREEVIGRLGLSDVLRMSGVAFHKEGSHEYKRKGFINNVEADMILKDKVVVPAILNAVAVVDAKGNFLNSRCTVFDNTERKKAEEEVRQSNRELEAFSYSVSHDLRAPLRSVDGYAQILKDDYHDKIDSEGKRVIDVIINNAKRMGQLIDDLLDFSRAGRTEIKKSRINMNDFVRSILNELMEHEKNRKVVIDIHELHTSSADINTIRQVWVNLLSNALKYTQKRDEARIEIGSCDGPKEVVYYVKDNGVGFNMQFYDKLFGVFQRLHKAKDFEGTGVGLAFVKRIIDRHDGRVWAEAEMNEGASFYFSIPKLQ
jgi:PAS domain S-box-containing protein